MATETYQLFRAHAKAQGHKGLSRSTNLSLSHTYVLTTPSEARESQVRDDFERITAMCEASATRGEDGRVANLLTECFWIEFFDRLNRNESPAPLTCDMAIVEAADLCGHMKDVLGELSKKGGPIPDRVAVELAELIVAARRVLVRAEAADDVDSGAAEMRLPARMRRVQ